MPKPVSPPAAFPARGKTRLLSLQGEAFWVLLALMAFLFSMHILEDGSFSPSLLCNPEHSFPSMLTQGEDVALGGEE